MKLMVLQVMGGLALDVVNRVRHRGNFAALKPEKYVE